MIYKFNWKRDEFDFQCWRCEMWVNISDMVYVPFFNNRLLAFITRYPVRYMCYDCIDELSILNRTSRYGIFCPNQYCSKSWKVFKSAHDVFHHARGMKMNGHPECMEALDARLKE